MTAREMELSQAAHRFFSPWYSVAMAPCSYRPKTEDVKHIPESVSVCQFIYEPTCMDVDLCLRIKQQDAPSCLPCHLAMPKRKFELISECV